MSYENKLIEARSLETAAAGLREEAEQVKREEVKRAGISGWLGYNFESSSGLTEEWAAFSRQMKKELIKIMSGYELVDYSRGHFFFSVFFKKEQTGKLVYISCSDVRFFPDEWHNNLLIRTAEHAKDYTGGSNGSATLTGLKTEADKLTK